MALANRASGSLQGSQQCWGARDRARQSHAQYVGTHVRANMQPTRMQVQSTMGARLHQGSSLGGAQPVRRRRPRWRVKWAYIAVAMVVGRLLSCWLLQIDLDKSILIEFGIWCLDHKQNTKSDLTHAIHGWYDFLLAPKQQTPKEWLRAGWIMRCRSVVVVNWSMDRGIHVLLR